METATMYLTNSDIRKLYDFNQEAKSIFYSYTIHPSGLVTGNTTLGKGIHYIINGYVPEILTGNYITIYPLKLFKAINNNKKDIQKCVVDNSTITLMINKADPIIIGLISKTKPTFLETYDIEDIDVYTKLSKNDVESLVSNNLLEIDGKYKTRITRELIPGLKKAHSVEYRTYDDGDNENLFKLKLKVNRKGIISYHVYTALFI